MNNIATELRIGNYEQAEELSIPKLGIQSVKINGKAFGSIASHGIHLVDEGKTEFKPIRITPEWLIEFGCQKIKDNDYELSGAHQNKFRIRYSSIAEEIHSFGIIYFDKPKDVYNFTWNIQYVHQLQNLFYALTGTELILK